ncbi:MAG TPA: hypothetical protein VIV60_05430 [Polyangiaceae bacterium]
MRRPLAIAWFVLFAWTRAVSAATVVVVRPSNPSAQATETLTLLHGELVSVGLEDSTIERPAASSPAATDLRSWLEQLEGERDAVAVIEMLGDDGVSAVDVWVRKSSGRFEVTRVAVDPHTANASARLAIRAIEALRASLMEADFAARYHRDERPKQRASTQPPQAPQPPQPLQPPQPAAATGGHERFRLELGAALLMSPGGVGPAILPTLRADWALRPTWLVQAAIAAFGSDPKVTTTTGSARVGRETMLVGGCYRFWTDQAFWPFFSLAVGAMHTSVEGQPGSAMDSHIANQWSLLTDAGLGAMMRFYRFYHLALSGHVQVAEPRITIHFGEPAAATTGRPNLLLTLGVGAWL